MINLHIFILLINADFVKILNYYVTVQFEKGYLFLPFSSSISFSMYVSCVPPNITTVPSCYQDFRSGTYCPRELRKDLCCMMPWKSHAASLAARKTLCSYGFDVTLWVILYNSRTVIK